MSESNGPEVILGLDVGNKRIGLALARTDVRISNPLTTLANDDQFESKLRTVIDSVDVTRVVVGLPLGMSGQWTEQTAMADTFAARLRRILSLPVILQEETLTSVKAEEELRARGKPYEKGDVDALAATFILQDYIETAHV